ncbi:MAG: hypothetical protein FJ146_13035 [Deltaproteobacteria bacterium]|nr:hypothetical protein [Deltaproteobacteria bacterium]
MEHLQKEALATILAMSDDRLAAYAAATSATNVAVLLSVMPIKRANQIFATLPPSKLAAALGHSKAVPPNGVVIVARELEQINKGLGTPESPREQQKPTPNYRKTALSAAPFILIASVAWAIYFVTVPKHKMVMPAQTAAERRSSQLTAAAAKANVKNQQVAAADSGASTATLTAKPLAAVEKLSEMVDVLGQKDKEEMGPPVQPLPVAASGAKPVNMLPNATKPTPVNTAAADSTERKLDTDVVEEDDEGAGLKLTEFKYSLHRQQGMRISFRLRNDRAVPALGSIHATARYLHRDGRVEIIDSTPHAEKFKVRSLGVPKVLEFKPNKTDGTFVDLIIDVRNLKGLSLLHRQFEVTGT